MNLSESTEYYSKFNYISVYKDRAAHDVTQITRLFERFEAPRERERADKKKERKVKHFRELVWRELAVRPDESTRTFASFV